MAVLGCAAGSVAMACVGMLTNYFLIIPFYSQVMPLQAIFDACNAINPYVTGMQGYLLLGVLPFNLVIKGAILTAITMLAYKKLSVFIKSKQIELHHSRQRVGEATSEGALHQTESTFLFNNRKQCGSIYDFDKDLYMN